MNSFSTGLEQCLGSLRKLHFSVRLTCHLGSVVSAELRRHITPISQNVIRKWKRLRAYLRVSISLSVSGPKPAGNGRVYSVLRFQNLTKRQILRWRVRFECRTLRPLHFRFLRTPADITRTPWSITPDTSPYEIWINCLNWRCCHYCHYCHGRCRSAATVWPVATCCKLITARTRIFSRFLQRVIIEI